MRNFVINLNYNGFSLAQISTGNGVRRPQIKESTCIRGRNLDKGYVNIFVLFDNTRPLMVSNRNVTAQVLIMEHTTNSAHMPVFQNKVFPRWINLHYLGYPGVAYAADAHIMQLIHSFSQSFIQGFWKHGKLTVPNPVTGFD